MPKIYYSIGMIILLFVELIIGYFFHKKYAGIMGTDQTGIYGNNAKLIFYKRYNAEVFPMQNLKYKGDNVYVFFSGLAKIPLIIMGIICRNRDEI
ncbi:MULTISPECIES: hypothetical protein [unclassified Cytobacillus]|uniref:hypothetical protein n=1 Tax=unclassified Cytobacillus TaxID=2675268 RepID=UPI0020406655|nr:hypothetical protein [Cytobacillus sp. AMY 15.2]MCM3090319.1 hypothetical protein [Cytobacillus sp. AMY 15.2]